MEGSFEALIFDGPFRVTPRPEPIPGDLRLSWGLVLVVLILGSATGRKASLYKLHFMAHSIRTSQNRRAVQDILSGDMRTSDFIIKVEPWLNRTLGFAKELDIIGVENGRQAKLTNKGAIIFDAIIKDPSLFSEEKDFLDAVSKAITEANVRQIVKAQPIKLR